VIACGVDEAGRGPLAGPVFAAAVILHPDRPIQGLADSKVLAAKRRDHLAAEIKSHAWAWCVAQASAREVDTLNVLQAALLAMARAVEGLAVKPQLALVDGNRQPSLTMAVRTVVGGDATVPSISAASILAKTARDAHMTALAQRYPGYGFERHMGYPTAFHLQALRRLGPCAEHRRSFAPVAQLGLDLQDRP
jgi:ribonuclease HII